MHCIIYGNVSVAFCKHLHVCLIYWYQTDGLMASGYSLNANAELCSIIGLGQFV